MNSNLIFATNEKWQDFIINGWGIYEGQPVVKADRASKLLPLERRCDMITTAAPKVRGFANSQHKRMYLPWSIDQVATFLLTHNIRTTISFNDDHVKITCRDLKGNKYETKHTHWYNGSALMFLELKKAKLI